MERSLSRYEILERIAVGGMAEVFRARAFGAHGFEKTLAIKRILPDLARHAEFERRFIAEAKLAVTLAHANIVQVMDFGRAGASLYIAMELVDGPNLSAVLRWHADRGQCLPVGVAFYVCMEALKGLEFAHGRGVVHRDVSPSNILLSRAGEVKIADFGIAKATDVGDTRAGAGRVMGKWPYMSPEQTRGEELDGRSDLFSAGVIAWELLTGQRLFHGPDVESMIKNVCERPVPPASSVRPELPAALDAIFARALARGREARYTRAADMLRALLEVCFEHKVVATGLELPELIGRAFPGGAGAVLEPSRWAESTAPPPTRVTQTAAPPAPEITRMTLVPGDVGADGVTVWEVRNDDAPRPRRRAWLLIPAALVALAAPAWYLLSRPSAPPPAPSPAPATVASPAPQPEPAPPPPSSAPAPAPPPAPELRYTTISIHTEPWSEIWLGGKKLADAPVKDLRLPHGRHKLRLVNPIRKLKKTLVVDLPGRRRYSVNLED